MKRFLILPALAALLAFVTPAQADCGAGQPPAGSVCAAPAGVAGTANYRALANGHIPSSIDAAKIGGGSVSTTEYDRLDGITSFGQALLGYANEAAFKTGVNLEAGVDYQAFDADLTTWAAISPSANVQSLVSAANYAAMRGLLDLEAGTDFYSISAANAAFQALDSDLTTWAGLTPSANAQSLVTAANYAAMRGLLDLEAGTDFYSISGANAAFQPLDSDLTTWATLSPSADAQALVTAANYAAMRGLLDLEAGTDFYSISAANAAFQPIDADLTSWAGVTRASGFDTFTTTSSSANLRGLLTDEVGSGALMFGIHADMADNISCAADEFVQRNGTDTGWECSAVPGGGDALTADPLSQFAATSSSQLRGVMSDEVGTGPLMFGLISTMNDDLGCTASQFVRRNSGDTAFECVSGGGSGITAVVEDTAPQLGGNLDPNGFTVGDATEADLTKLNALTATATELNFVDGVTSAIQTQIDGKQASDADLTTWAGLTPSANAQSLVTAANYAAMRGLLDLEAGTDFYSIAAADAAFQPIDVDLTSWAGVTRASGFDTFTATPSSANLRSLLTDESGTGVAYFAGGDAGTPSAIVLINGTGLPVAGITPSTSTAIGVGSIELGHATNTTIGRPGAGDISVEGNIVYRAGGTNVAIADGGCNADDAATCFANIKQAASLTATGVGELATDAEAQAKSDTARLLTPSNLAALGTSDTFQGLCELATTAEAAAQTDTARCITPQGLAFKPESLCVAASDESTDLTTGTAKVTFRMPYAFTLTNVRASVNDAAAGTLITVDINEAGSTIMTTNKLTIDIAELTSVTAATAVGITDSALADDAEMKIDIDGVGTTAKGLKVCLIGHQ